MEIKLKEQSSIEWLIEQLKSRYDIDIERLSVTDKAKSIHKKEIIEANMSARLEMSNSILQKKIVCEKSEQYYNEKYM